MENYPATFGIDGGVSPGFGVKYPDYIEKDIIIQAENGIDAVDKAYDKAKELSREHLSNPNTGTTKVFILSIYNNRHRLDVAALVDWNKIHDGRIKVEDKRLVARCSTLEHLASM